MSRGIIDLHGDALDAALGRRFTTAMEEVSVGDSKFVLRRPENADHLISEADYVMDERLPYWADLWPSSRVLAAALLDEKGSGRRLLELGCGLGLATIAAMQAGFEVTATDYYEDAIHVTRANAWRNLGREPDVRLVNWREWPDDFGTFDVVIAADVVYEKEYAILVATCLARALNESGEAIIADPGRLALPDFRSQLEQEGLEVVSWSTTPYVSGKINQNIELLRIRRLHPKAVA